MDISNFLLKYQSDHLFLLVGTNPLPNYIAGKLLAKSSTHFYFVHTIETNEIVERLIKVLNLTDEKWSKILVDQANTRDIYSKIYEEAKGKKNVGLHYTSGTKSMSVHAYIAIYDSDTDSLYDRIFSYLDARTLELLIDRNQCDPVKLPAGLSVRPTIEELMALHGYTPSIRKRYVKTPFHPEIGKHLLKVPVDELRRWCNENLHREYGNKLLSNSKLSAVLLPSTGSFKNMTTCWEGFKTLGELAGHWGRDPGFMGEWLDGKWLEHYTLHALQEIAKVNDIHTSVLSLKPNEKDFELDVVALKGYQLIVLSCTTSFRKDSLKEKLFEAFVRGKQLGGDEAKIGLICFANDSNPVSSPRKIQEEIEEDWDAKGKFCVLGLNDLENLSSSLQEWFRSF